MGAGSGVFGRRKAKKAAQGAAEQKAIAEKRAREEKAHKKAKTEPDWFDLLPAPKVATSNSSVTETTPSESPPGSYLSESTPYTSGSVLTPTPSGSSLSESTPSESNSSSSGFSSGSRGRPSAIVTG